MRKLSVYVLTAAVLLSLALSCLAAEVPDPNRSCTLTLTVQWNKKPISTGRLTLYRVGEVAKDGGDYFFAVIPELGDSGVSLEDLEDSQLPRKLEKLALRRKLKPVSADIEKGKAVFGPLKQGLYVVTQLQEDACEGFAPIHPFLISLPRWDGSGYIYDLTANPKVSLEETAPKPTEKEDEKSSDSRLPQTGQLNWPVPVMAVSGIALILTGWLLLSGKRGRNA